jgi:glutamate 5-kinase
MPERERLAYHKKIVSKVGSSTLTHSNGNLNLLRIDKLVRVITDLHNSGKEVLLVSSGAIATGAGKAGIEKKPEDNIIKQALAAIGQAELIKIYDRFFEEYNKTVAQVLLTRDGIENPLRRKNARNTLNALLEMGIIPVINENDTVITEEIEFGDNDILSSMVANLISADLLIILSDIDGLYSGNPETDRDAKLIPKVLDFEEDLESYIYDSGEGFGTGGMSSKLLAARNCCKNGIDMLILNGSNPTGIFQALEGQPTGTFFMGSKQKIKN